jgi:hypothetical protein
MVMHASLTKIESGEADAYRFLSWQFHSLAGIGGTFGHHDLTEIALDGEEACNAGAPPMRIAHFVAMVAQFGSALGSGSADGLADVSRMFIPVPALPPSLGKSREN